MKKLIQFIVIGIFLIFICQSLFSQTTSQATQQKILNKLEQIDQKVNKIDDRLDQFEKKVDKKFAEIDKRLVNIETILAVHNERFRSIQSTFAIFGSVAGLVILIALAVLGYFFNQLNQLIKQTTRIQDRFEFRRESFEEQLFQDDIIKKLKIVLSDDFVPSSRVADEKVKYKVKPTSSK